MSAAANAGERMAGAALHLLCAGAAKGLVLALQERFTTETGATLQARFGAVGAMKEALQSGAACDVFVVTAAMIDSLVAAGELRAEGSAPLGRVRTGVAVRAGAPTPAIGDAAGLRNALSAADALYFPDPARATAGIHFADVMRRLGIHDALAPRLRTFPNGATAMRALADEGTPASIGCTQVTEIRYTEGVTLAGALPGEFELATVYAGAVTRGSQHPELARRFLDLLTGPASRPLRESGGFEF